MHCPRCGHEEVSGETKFCRACGFEIEDVKLLVSDKKSERARERRISVAFNQGLGLMLVSLVLVIIMTLLGDLDLIPEFYVKLVGAIFVVAGLARMFYPYVFGGDNRIAEVRGTSESGAETSRLPQSLPSQSIPATDWSQHGADTAGLIGVPSVTEHTTRKLADPTEDN